MNIIKELKKKGRQAIQDHEDYREQHYDMFNADCVQHLAFLDGVIAGIKDAVRILEATKKELVEEALFCPQVSDEWVACTDEEQKPSRKKLLELLKRGIYANDSGVATDFYSGALSVFGHNK